MAPDSDIHFHTITGEHPEHGQYELTFQVVDETDYHLESSRSTFPTEGHEDRMECIEHASDHLTTEMDAEKVLVDEETI